MKCDSKSTWTSLSTQSRLCFILYSVFLSFLPSSPYVLLKQMFWLHWNCILTEMVLSVFPLYLAIVLYSGGKPSYRSTDQLGILQSLLDGYCSLIFMFSWEVLQPILKRPMSWIKILRLTNICGCACRKWNQVSEFLLKNLLAY